MAPAPSFLRIGPRLVRGLTLTAILALSFAPAASSARATDEHIVLPGETLSAIAQRYGVSVAALVALNGIADPDTVRSGVALRIPGPDVRVHVVEDGETLSSVAALFGVTPSSIAEANGLFDQPRVISGATLLVPAPDASTSAAAVLHVVRPGDVLLRVAETYHVLVGAIVAANQLSDPNLIREGQTLIIPGGPGAVPPGEPAAPTTPAPGVASSSGVHTVARGESLTSVAALYDVSVAGLAEANNLTDDDDLITGERLLIPTATTPSQVTGYAEGVAPPFAPASAVTVRRHTVAPGESLGAIADMYHVSREVIATANNLADPNLIVAGQILEVPGDPGPVTLTQDQYERLLERAAADFDVRPAVVKALAWQESGWNQSAVSHMGAVGVMQVTPWTAHWALATLVPNAGDWQTDPSANITMGTAILKHWLVRSDGDLATALGSYYQGWRSFHDDGAYEDTKAYVANILDLVSLFEEAE